MIQTNALPKLPPAHGYPKLLFHLFRLFQFFASLIVAGVMVFFTIHLRGHRITIPWFFFFLQAAALTMIVWLIVSTILLCRHKLSPSSSAVANALIGSVWIIAFSLLAWRMDELTFRSCTIELWGDEKGVLVCKLYKFLFGATVVGIVANICAFVLDLRVNRWGDSRGKYSRTIVEQVGTEPFRHKTVFKGPVSEDTQYLRPITSEHLYSAGSRSPSPDAFEIGRQ